MPLEIQKPAPNWNTIAVDKGQFSELTLKEYAGKYVVLFFYPSNGPFVSAAEVTDFSDHADEFRKINCELIAASTDSHFEHLAWVNTSRQRGGLGRVTFPILADKTGKIARDYGVLNEVTGVAYRALFIIDDKQIVRQITINDLPVVRSVDETLRLVQAFQYADEHGKMCPADWKPALNDEEHEHDNKETVN